MILYIGKVCGSCGDPDPRIMIEQNSIQGIAVKEIRDSEQKNCVSCRINKLDPRSCKQCAYELEKYDNWLELKKYSKSSGTVTTLVAPGKVFVGGNKIKEYLKKEFVDK